MKKLILIALLIFSVFPRVNAQVSDSQREAMKHNAELNEAMEEAAIKEAKEAEAAKLIKLSDQLNELLESNQLIEANLKIDELIEIQPHNTTFHFTKGSICESLGKEDLASHSYKKAIEIDPSYYYANYSLGALYFNKAASIQKQVNQNPDLEEINSLHKKVALNFSSALPYFEKCMQIQKDSTSKAPGDNIKEILLNIYSLLGMNDKYNQLKNE